METLFYTLSNRINSILFTILFLVSGCQRHNEHLRAKNDIADMHLKGRIKSLTETVFENTLRPGQLPAGVAVYWETYKFNTDGNILESRRYDREGDLRGSTLYKYDRRGTLTEKNELDHNGELILRENYLTDKEGLNVEKDCYRPPDSQWNIAIYYDEKGNLRKASYNNLVKSQRIKVLYQNDKRGNISEEKTLIDGRLTGRNTYLYDEKNNLIEVSIYDERDSMGSNEYYKYDESGNLVFFHNSYRNGGIEQTRTYKYDEKGNVLQIMSTYGDRTSYDLYKYDNFDSKGNWHSRSYTYPRENRWPSHIINTERTIEYY